MVSLLCVFFHFGFRVLNFLLSTTTPAIQNLWEPTSPHDAEAALLSNVGKLRDLHFQAWPGDGWKSLEERRLTVPSFTVATMTGYFISGKVASDNKEAADFSSVSDKAYRLFSKGYIQRIEVCSPPNKKENFSCIANFIHK